jgi:hypothetical protein
MLEEMWTRRSGPGYGVGNERPGAAAAVRMRDGGSRPTLQRPVRQRWVLGVPGSVGGDLPRDWVTDDKKDRDRRGRGQGGTDPRVRGAQRQREGTRSRCRCPPRRSAGRFPRRNRRSSNGRPDPTRAPLDRLHHRLLGRKGRSGREQGAHHGGDRCQEGDDQQKLEARGPGRGAALLPTVRWLGHRAFSGAGAGGVTAGSAWDPATAPSFHLRPPSGRMALPPRPAHFTATRARQEAIASAM